MHRYPTHPTTTIQILHFTAPGLCGVVVCLVAKTGEETEKRKRMKK
jgi:hypothetical protein